jgi:hypothetical protein
VTLPQKVPDSKSFAHKSFVPILKGCGNVGMHGNRRLRSLVLMLNYVNQNLLGELELDILGTDI